MEFQTHDLAEKLEQLGLDKQELEAQKLELQSERDLFEVKQLEREAKHKCASSASSDPDMKALKANLEAERAQLEAEKSKLRIAQSQLMTAQLQLEDAKMHLEYARSDLETAREHLEAALGETVINNKKLEAAKNSIKAAKIRFDIATKEMNAAKHKFESAKKTLEDSTPSVNKDNKANEETVAELNESKEQVKSLLKKLSDLENHCNEKKALHEKVDELKNELSQSKVENESLSQKMKEQEVQCRVDKKTLEEKVDEFKKQLQEKETKVTKTVNPKVFFDMNVDGNSVGRVYIELFADIAPRAAENFRALCTGEKGVGRNNGRRLHYKGSVLKKNTNYWLGGDIGGQSIYGGTVIDRENFINNHSGIGDVGMVNGTEFFISRVKLDRWGGSAELCGRVLWMENGLDDLVIFGDNILIVDCGQLS